MKLYLASCELAQYEHIEPYIHQCKYMLGSFFSLRKCKHQSLFNAIEALNAKGSFILDSGAFSMFGGATVKIDAYIDDYILLLTSIRLSSI